MFWRSFGRSYDDRSRAEREKEELDRAIALSLSKDFSRPYGYQLHIGNDLDSGRPFLNSRISPSFRPFVPRESHPRELSRVCAGCKRDIGHGRYLGCMGSFFHPECFCCDTCGRQITEREFSLSEKKIYHRSCFKEMNHPKCDVCLQFIPIDRDGLIEYKSHPYWSQKYCPSHEHDGTKRCCCCERLESRNAKCVSLGDGRSLCLECMETAIMDTADCQPLYNAIRDFYEGMNMKIVQQIPLLLVERQALNEAVAGERHVTHHMPETRGLCLSEEQTVSVIQRRPVMWGEGLIGMRTQPLKLNRRCEVTAILVLFGLPRLLTGAILAHELMHAWLRLSGFFNLNTEVEEGICQVLAYMWLESEVTPGYQNMSSSSSSTSSSCSSSKSGYRSPTENKLGQFFKHQIVNDASPEYGGGFRAANAAVNKFGLRYTLGYIHRTGTLPM